VLTIEPGMSFAQGKEMVHEENILITEEGSRILTVRAPAEMQIVLN
ncbi:MAG: aminopeptidase P family protein, partial [SAR324 cluster bacterium]|nr:aminopeptidase P family protein [SAR324 cluster bacterium]